MGEGKGSTEGAELCSPLTRDDSPLIDGEPAVSSIDGHKCDDPEVDDETEQYIQNCAKYGMRVDSSVVITLRSRWSILQPTRAFCEGCLLPLANILGRNNYIKTLNLSGAGVTNVKAAPGNGNSNARVLHQILATNQAIESLDISNTAIDDEGVHEVCEGLKKNATVTSLNLSRNSFGEKGVQWLQDMLERNRSVRYIDISRNALGFHSINTLQCCGAPRRVEMKVEGNYVFEEIMNSLTHGLGFVASVVGTILLMSEVAGPGSSPYHFWSCMIFSLSLMVLYLSSTLYHSFFMLPYAKDILQVLDHVGIYLLIAGSYTPFMMIALHHNTSANVLLVVEWVTALIGICVSLATSGVGCSSQATNFVEVIIFLAMGCGVFCVWEQVVVSLPLMALRMLIAGGMAYIFGIAFFVLGEIKPIYHTVWHVFVMVGSLLHWLCIYHFILVIDIPLAVATRGNGLAL